MCLARLGFVQHQHRRAARRAGHQTSSRQMSERRSSPRDLFTLPCWAALRLIRQSNAASLQPCSQGEMHLHGRRHTVSRLDLTRIEQLPARRLDRWNRGQATRRWRFRCRNPRCGHGKSILARASRRLILSQARYGGAPANGAWSLDPRYTYFVVVSSADSPRLRWTASYGKHQSCVLPSRPVGAYPGTAAVCSSARRRNPTPESTHLRRVG
jgi:hypothetical protein